MVPGTAVVDGPRRPPRGGGGADHGHWPGIPPSADGGLGRWGVSPAAADGCFAPCAAREFRWLRPATGGAAPWKPRFGQRAAGWQEVSARNFVSEQGAASPPYWMYGKKLGRSYGAKGPATPADIPVVSCPTEKNRVKLLSFYKNRVQGSTDGGGAVTVMGVPVTGWKNEMLWDQRHMGNSSGSDQYFRSPANGIPRPENCARI